MMGMTTNISLTKHYKNVAEHCSPEALAKTNVTITRRQDDQETYLQKSILNVLAQLAKNSAGTILVWSNICFVNLIGM